MAIVDLAQGGSWLETLCGVPAGPGILDLVSGAADFTKVIGRDAKSTVHLLRYGAVRTPRAKVLLAERIESVLGALGHSYDAVIVNAGEAALETPVLLHKCDGVLVLAPAAHMAEANNAVEALLTSGVRAARTVRLGDAMARADFTLKSVNA